MSTERPAERGRASALAVSAWPLRRKVALALTIPLLLAGTLGGLRVRGDLEEAANSSSSAKQVTALRPAVDYLTAAEEAMIAAVGSAEDRETVLEASLTDVREAGRELLAAKDSADLTPDQRYQVDALLDLSQVLRGDDALTLSPGTWVAQLRQLQSGVTRLIGTIVDAQLTPEPRLELLSQTLAGRFSLAMQQALVATERTGETGSLELFAELGVEGAAIDRLAGALGAGEKAVASLRTANAQRFRTVRTGGTDLGGATAYADYDSIVGELQNGIDDELEVAAAAARSDAAVNATVTLAALAAAIMLALLVSRLLLNPIQRVREGALAVAHERLPAAVARIRAGEEPGEITPIDVTTEEEIGQLARAVEDLHRQAVVLAADEAGLRSQVSQMFVTLSRRSTSLINQQLGLIERLERDEEDPKRLDSLFRLDHLAARMRRTADSLLILADAPTANAVADELTVSDALQAATSGVQDYQRVRVRSGNPMRIDRTAAADVVHLLTELVDNALTYSPPTSTVTVGSTTTDQGVLIEVTDAGLGIPADELDKVNDGIRSGGEVTPDTARRMGLFVVSRLSQRHGISTSLRSNEDGGTTATVLLPIAVLPDLAPQPAPAPRVAPVAHREPTPAAEPREHGRAVADATAEETSVVEGTVEKTSVVEGTAEETSVVEGTAETPAESRGDAAPGLPIRSRGAGLAQSGTGPTTSDAPAALRPLGNGSARRPPEVNGVSPAAPAALRPLNNGSVQKPDEAQRPESTSPAESTTPAEATEAKDDRVTEPVTDRVAVRADVPTPPSVPASTHDALGGDWTDPGDEGSDTPIFRSLRSAWLSSGDDAQPWRTSEIEAGWEVAEQVAAAAAKPEVSESGLPLRRPGTRLVPGGVATTPTVTVRDPEAIRARLAAHASGVSRGRAAATAAPDPSYTEAGS